VTHAFGTLKAVDRLSLEIARGELVCLLGPSGCGKTTALRIAAGLELLQQGRVRLEGRTVAEPGRDLAPEARGVGLVFQDFALFPHLSVRDNVAFGLRGLGAAERRDRVDRMLAQVDMADQAESWPHTLSGGQQQRIALARALAPRPPVMLLDEPFSGLDASLRNLVRDQTLHLLKESGAATLMVTHDPEEAMFMADRIALMRAGRLVQVGRPTELYFSPVDAFVAGFFGDINRLEGEVHGGGVATPFGDLSAAWLGEGTPVDVLIRPEALHLEPLPEGAPPPGTGTVLAARLLGRTSLVHLSVGGGCRPDADGELHLHARVPGRFLPEEGHRLSIRLDLGQTFIFPRSG
jgi:iron(III) transport system ATP-binding protein